MSSLMARSPRATLRIAFTTADGSLLLVTKPEAQALKAAFTSTASLCMVKTRMRARGLKPGRYRLVLTAADEVGNRSPRRTLALRVVRLPR